MADLHDDVINPATHHETSDVDVRALMWFAVIFIAFAIVTHLLLYVMFKFFVQIARGSTNAPLTAIARPADIAIPAAPRLQPFPRKQGDVTVPPNATTPPVDMQQMLREQENALNNPGWVDRQKGIVRIPIDVAKKLVVQRGLPVVHP